MINNIKSNLKKAFNKKVFQTLSSKIISAISALAIINASAAIVDIYLLNLKQPLKRCCYIPKKK